MCAVALTSNTASRRNRQARVLKHIARKRFGQHFLADSATIEAIVRAIDPRPGQPMLEIGPGLAALTQPLVERLGRLAVVELDRDLAARLRGHGLLEVIESDVLKLDFRAVADRLAPAPARLRVVGNLPYNHLVSFAAAGRAHRGPALHAAKGSHRPNGGGAGNQRLRAPECDAAMALRHGVGAVRSARLL
jgi:hypothetical protein